MTNDLGLANDEYAVAGAPRGYDQVIAQFGADSNELQALGLKKKSEYKSPKAKKPATP